MGDPPPQRDLVFASRFREDLRYWVETDRRTAIRVLALVEAVSRDPFSGVGNPEPLRHLGPGVWSRRINQRDRFVYIVSDGRIDLLQARFHYE